MSALPFAKLSSPTGSNSLFAQHTEPLQLHVDVKGKSLTSMASTITDANTGALIFRTDPVGISGRVINVVAADGEVLMTVARDRWAWRNNFKGTRGKEDQGDKEVLFTTKSGRLLGWQKLAVEYENSLSANPGQRQALLGVKVERGTSLLTTHEGELLARFTRPTGGSHIVNLASPYQIEIAPNLDAALCVGLWICLHSIVLINKSGTIAAIS
ncbi:unnamed protein product [Parajaminaea phylloscopi]